MKKLFCAILLIGAALGYAGPALSQGAKTIDVAFYEAGYFNSNGKGIDRDVIEEIKNRGGYSFNYVEWPRVRIWSELENGQLAMSVSGLQTAARDKFAYFVPYIKQPNKALVTNAKYKTAESVVSDKGARIAVVRGFKHGDFFDTMIDKMRANGGVIEVPTIHNLFLMLQAGERIDLVVSQPAFYAKELKDLGMESKVVIYDWDSANSNPLKLSLILSKAKFTEQDAAKMKEIIASMKKDGTLKKIFAKYLSPQDVEDSLNF